MVRGGSSFADRDQDVIGQAQSPLWVDTLNLRPAAADGIDRLPRGIELRPQLTICVALPGDEVAAHRQHRQCQFSQFGHGAHGAGDKDRPAGALLRLSREVFRPLGQYLEGRRRLAGGGES